MLEKGQMVLDVLLKQGVPVAYTRAHITARVVSKRDRIGKALDIDDTLAALEIDHVTCTAEGAPVEHSTDIFLPRSLDLHVMRWLQDVPPVPAIGRAQRALTRDFVSARSERQSRGAMAPTFSEFPEACATAIRSA